MARWYVPHYWMIPLVGAVVWLGTSITMLVVWSVTGYKHYPSMCADCSVPYISDVGADTLKPLFIVGSAITGVCFFLAISSERFLRHRGRLVANSSTAEKVLVGISIFGAALGAISLILLSVFDVARNKNLHDLFLLLFVLGTFLAAVFIIIEFWRLNKKNRQNKGIVHSFYAKCIFVAVLLPSSIVFGVLMMMRKDQGKTQDIAAGIEWAIAFLFTGFNCILIWDLYPATKTINGEMLAAEKHSISRNQRNSDSTNNSRLGA